MQAESELTRQKLLLIDGHNLLFQMFYGMPSTIIGNHGKPIHGTLGFVGGLLKIIRMTAPTHVVVIFDGETGSDRAETYPEYKSNRIDYSQVPEEENPFSQLDDIKKALDCMGIKYFESNDGAEADDVIACYVHQFKEDMEVIISSADTDFIQLICDNVSQLVYRGQNTIVYNPSKVTEKWGVSPQCFAGYKSLIGDKSDNIMGIPKIGPKTAAQLIKDFGSAEAAAANAEQIKKPSIRATLCQHSERIKVNLDLITLNKVVPLPYGLDQLALRQDTESLSTTDVLVSIGIK